jgi:hypothetical protein
MAFVKNSNGKAVECAYEDGALLVPDSGYVAAIIQHGDIHFFGASDDAGVIAIGSTANGSEVATLAEAKTAIATLGTLFLDGVAV